MKKLFAALLAIMMVLSLAACGNQEEEPTPTPEYDYNAKSEGVLTYSEYAALPSDGTANVVVEGYVQGAQSYWNGAKLYLQDPDGAYFVYCEGAGADVNISEEDFAKCVKSTEYTDGWLGEGTGVKVKVSGTKSEWSGEVEIINCTVEVVDTEHTWFAEAIDVTDKLGTDALAESMNQKVALKGMKVEASKVVDENGNETEVPFLYNWDGSGSEGSDLYFNVSVNGATYNFCVESYLAYNGTAVYDGIEALNIGDTVDLEGFLYWYNGAQPHITSVTVK